MTSLQDQFGAIDVYLFDQLLKNRIRKEHAILDAGCGGGRNLVYLLREGFDVHAFDSGEQAVARTRALGESHGRDDAEQRIQVAVAESLPYADGHFDVVLANALLHFARDDDHFDAMVAELFRVLRPGGLFFARLASDIGIEEAVVSLGAGRYRLPDGSDRYLVNEARLVDWAARVGGELVDPIKTTNVQGLRCMTTWVVRLAGNS